MSVFVWRSPTAEYPSAAPFHPQQLYPESPFPEVSAEPNHAYAAVRSLFELSGWDRENFGKLEWNPLRELVKPGDRVLLKPNMIKATHPRYGDGWKWMLTHGSLVRAVADYVAIALRGRGEIIIADAPQTDSSFRDVVKVLGFDVLAQYFRGKGLAFHLVDLRQYEWDAKDDVVVARRTLSGDPHNYFTIDLGADSFFYGFRGEGRYYGADYDTTEINAHHRGKVHEYVLSGSAITADVFINLPKMKTHKKTGVTLSLKNLVGINGDKNYLPHYTEGTPQDGGDQYPDRSARTAIERSGLKRIRRIALEVPGIGPWLYRQIKKVGGKVVGTTSEVVRSGNWHGNDTCWRMCLDLNRVLTHAGRDGKLGAPTAAGTRRQLTIIDGLVAGDGDGPVDVDRVDAGVLLMSSAPAEADAVAARVMGFDPEKLAIVREAFALERYRLATGRWKEITVTSNFGGWNRRLDAFASSDCFAFHPHFGWTGQIEFASKLKTEREVSS